MSRRYPPFGVLAYCVACSLLVTVAAVGPVAQAASFATSNFIVHTSDPRLARRFAEAAEAYRHQLAVEWLGMRLPDWAKPCPITAHVGPHLGAGGATTFIFDRGEVFGWRMTVQGPEERIVDSVLPHEITHMILASYFRRPLPRWADEGAATSVEHPSERAKYYRMLHDYLRAGRTIPLTELFRMQEYPPNMLVLYAQGYLLAEFLIQQGGRQKYVAFLKTALDRGDWEGALGEYYGYPSLPDFHRQWLAWVQQGARPLRPATELALPRDQPSQLASGRLPRPSPNLIHYVGPGESVPPLGTPLVVAAAPLVAVDNVLPTSDLAAGEKGEGGEPVVASQGLAGWSRPFTPGSIRVPDSQIYSTGVHLGLPFSTQIPQHQVLR